MSVSRDHGLDKNNCAAMTLVMNNTQLDFIPLHSWATSMEIPGS